MPGSAAAGAITPSLRLTPDRDYRAVLSHSLPVLPVHICSLVYLVHWTLGSTTGVLFTGKTAWYTAKQMMRVQFFLIYSCDVASPLCKQGGERSLKTPWHNTWKDKHRNLTVRWKSLMRGTTYGPLHTLRSCTTLTHTMNDTSSAINKLLVLFWTNTFWQFQIEELD